MSDDLTRIRDSLQRTCNGDATARRELEDGLRDLSESPYGPVVARWQEARLRGDSPSAEQLCAGEPSFAPTAAEVIRLVEDAQACLSATEHAGPTPSPDGLLPNVPGYEVLNVIGRGGMGIVYKARQLGFNRIVALKMIRSGAGADSAEIARFCVEAEAIARLQHPNIVQVYDIGEAEGCPYYSMEYLPGGSLAERARAEPLSPRQAAEIIEPLARAMHHAHQTGVIHRDLKPANVLFAACGVAAVATPQAALVPKITDFGLARLLDGDATRTTPGVVLGTACYLAPEQAATEDRQIGPGTDVYGLGAILYDLLTGRPPIDRGSWEIMLQRVRTQEPTDPSRFRPNVDRDLEAVCLKCLKKQPSRRYASAQDLADDLRRYLDGKPTKARPLGLAGQLGRSARRRPLITTALVLLLLLAAIVPFAAYFLNPERIPRENLRDLERGKSVPLIGETGPPRWYGWPIGEEVPLKSPPHDGTFAFSTAHYRLVELMPALPAAGYRLRAELRHDDSINIESEVGLYFASSKHRSGEEDEYTFYTVTFDDRKRQPVAADGTAGVLKVHGRRHNATTGFHAPTIQVLGHPFRTTGQDRVAGGVWRQLVIEVRPEQVDFFWEGQSVGVVTVAEMDRQFRILNKLLAKLPPPVPPRPALHPQFLPSQGAGLFLYSGGASFRRVVVEPL